MTRILILLAAILAGCGGGGDDREFVGPPDCTNHPEICA